MPLFHIYFRIAFISALMCSPDWYFLMSFTQNVFNRFCGKAHWINEWIWCCSVVLRRMISISNLTLTHWYTVRNQVWKNLCIRESEIFKVVDIVRNFQKSKCEREPITVLFKKQLRKSQTSNSVCSLDTWF